MFKEQNIKDFIEVTIHLRTLLTGDNALANFLYFYKKAVLCLYIYLPHTAYLLKEDSGRVTGQSGKLVIHWKLS